MKKVMHSTWENRTERESQAENGGVILLWLCDKSNTNNNEKYNRYYHYNAQVMCPA